LILGGRTTADKRVGPEVKNMIEKGKISAYQMSLLLYPTVMATAIVTAPSITFKYADRDLWLSSVWASVVGFLTVYVIDRLNKLYPKETFIQYCENILGILLGKLLGMIYLFYFLFADGIILREYAEFIIGNFFDQTPLLVVVGSLVFVSACAVRGGIEVLGRSTQVFSALYIVPFLLMVLVLLPDLKIRNMLPIMAHGIKPSILGAVAEQSWFCQVFFAAFFLPFLVNRSDGKKWCIITVLVITLNMIVANLTTLFLFGQITATLTYPIMSAARYVNVADFLEHLESAVMAIWVVGAFVKVSVYYYALALGTAQWLKMSDYRPLVFPYGLLILLFTFWVAPSYQKLGELIEKADIFEVTLLFTVIPALLLLLAVLRQRKHRREGKAS
jgi:spore germination protein KB